MQRKTKLMLTIMLLLAVAAVYLIYPRFQNFRSPDFYPVISSEPARWNEKESIHFFSEGWIICGTPSRFYHWDQSDMQPPFSQADLSVENGHIDIVSHTKNYITTVNNRVYNTQTIPFTLAYENKDKIIWDIKEYSGYLILMIKDEYDVAQPFVLVNNSDFLISLDGTGKAQYIAADAYDRDVSLLTISMDSPVPISRIFHYVNRNELYGVLTLEDQFIYNIYRFKNNIILIGIKELLCYNMEGELQWTLPHESGGLFEVLPGEDHLFLYFPEKTNLGEHRGNTLIIDEQGYTVEVFPKYLTNIKAFGTGYLALESNHTIIFLSQNGKVTKKQRLQEPIKWMETTSIRPNILLVGTQQDMLQLYTTEKQEEDMK